MAKYITLSSVIKGVNHKCCQIKTARKSVLITNFVPLGLFVALDPQLKLSFGEN